MYKTKFFKMVDISEGGCDYFVSKEDTLIPTAKEIVERFNLHSDCKNFPVTEITREEFLQGINNLLNEIVDSDLDMHEFSPNIKDNIPLWRYWEDEF